MAGQSRTSLLSRVTGGSLFSISLLFAFAICLPWLPEFSFKGLDPSWELSLHYFFEQGYLYGKDIIFTYGPYGFISTFLYYPATYRIMFFTYLFVVTVYTAASWDILGKTVKNKGAVFCAVLAASIFWSPVFNGFYTGDAFFYSCGVLFFVSCLTESDRPYRAMNFFLVGVLAAASLMKYSFFMWSFVLLFFVSLDGLLFRKKAPLLFLFYGGIFLALWFLARQPLAGLVPFLWNGAHVARYYGSAMSFPLTFYYLKFSLYLALSILLVAIFYIAQRRKTGRRAILSSLTLGAMAFLIFRAAFTRPDHFVLAWSFLALSGIYLVPFLGGRLTTKWWKCGLGLFLVATLSLACIFGIESFSKFKKKIQDSILKMPYYTFTASRFLPHPKDLEQRYANLQAAVRSLSPIPQLFGTVDSYPFDATGLMAWNLRYKPRPVFQSYTAYTPFLARKNADYFRGPEAPDFLIFAPNITDDGRPVDGRYPTLDDSLSLPEIMSRYDLIAVLDGKALLEKRRSPPRPYAFQPFLTVTTEFGKFNPVPFFDKGPIWVEIDIEPTWRGKLFEFLGRAGRALIVAKDLNGSVHTYTLPPVMARTGFLLSPVLDNPGGFIAFWTHRYDEQGLFHKEAVAVKLEVPPSFRGFFAPRFRIRFFLLNA